MAELKITAANFNDEVLHADTPVLLDFYADWCGPCKMLSPVLHDKQCFWQHRQHSFLIHVRIGFLSAFSARSPCKASCSRH